MHGTLVFRSPTTWLDTNLARYTNFHQFCLVLPKDAVLRRAKAMDIELLVDSNSLENENAAANHVM